jgi:hypothetical protein
MGEGERGRKKGSKAQRRNGTTAPWNRQRWKLRRSEILVEMVLLYNLGAGPECDYIADRSAGAMREKAGFL